MKRKKFQNIKRLSVYAFKHKREFFLSIAYGVLNNVFTLLSLLIGAYLTGLAFGKENAQQILKYFPWLFLSIVAKGIFAYLHMLVCHKMAYLVLEDLRGDVYDAALRGAPLISMKYRTGNISSIIMEDVESLESFFAHMFSDYLITAICTVVFTAVYFVLSWQAAFLSLAACAIIAYIPFLFVKYNEKNAVALREGVGEVNAGVVDTVQGLSEIMIFEREDTFVQKIMSETMNLNHFEVADGKMKAMEFGLIELVMSSVLIGVILLGHSMVISKEIVPSMVAVLITMSLNIFFPVVMVSQTAGKINMVAASADRIYTFLKEPSALCETDPTMEKSNKDVLISLKDVDFSYDSNIKVLSGLNLDIQKGEYIAITGESGVGKTTLMHLLLRFYDVDGGNIYLNQRDLRSMSPEEIRKNIAYVPQDVYLFRGSILDNLRLGKPDATMEEVRHAAKIALVDDFIESLENGYHSFVGERGLNLSGGQKQRIAIARALVSGTSVLIMDEAVSNLDTESEALFQEALKNIRKEKTIITVAHRKSTISRAQRVVTLKNGSILSDVTLSR